MIASQKRTFEEIRESGSSITLDSLPNKRRRQTTELGVVSPPAQKQVEFELETPVQDQEFGSIDTEQAVNEVVIEHGQSGVLQFLRASLGQTTPIDLVNDLDKVTLLLSERIDSAGLSNEMLCSATPDWLLKSLRKETLTWLQLLEAPLTVPTCKMDAVFSFQISAADSPPSSGRVLYLRSYTLTVEQLRRVLHDAKCPPAVSENFRNSLAKLQSEDNVTVRYIGQTTRMRAWDRHMNDVWHKTNPNLPCRFSRTLKSTYPAVLKTVRVQEFADAEDITLSGIPMIDFHERFFIAVFRGGLLNTSLGGTSSSWGPSGIDVKLFRSLGTDTFRLLQRTVHAPNDNDIRLANAYAAFVKGYVEEQNESTGLREQVFTKELEELLTQQGLGGKFENGFSPICFIAEKFPIKVLKTVPKAFFLAGLQGRQTGIALTAFNSFASWEQHDEDEVGPDDTFVRQLAERYCLPFVNTFPWFQQNVLDIPAAAALLKFYLHAANPLIVCTYGEHVSNFYISIFFLLKSQSHLTEC